MLEEGMRLYCAPTIPDHIHVPRRQTVSTALPPAPAAPRSTPAHIYSGLTGPQSYCHIAPQIAGRCKAVNRWRSRIVTRNPANLQRERSITPRINSLPGHRPSGPVLLIQLVPVRIMARQESLLAHHPSVGTPATKAVPDQPSPATARNKRHVAHRCGHRLPR